MAIRILITDNYGVMREGLRMYLSLDLGLGVEGAQTAKRCFNPPA